MLLEGVTGTSNDEVEAIAKEHIRYTREYLMRSKHAIVRTEGGLSTTSLRSGLDVISMRSRF